MFHNMKSKLRSNRGASMILVLALFFVCVMVSSVIVFNAANGISRNAQRTRQQRGYLAVSSAADFIVEEMKLSNTYVGKNTIKKYGCENCNIPVEMVYFGSLVNGYRLDADYIRNALDDGHLMIGKLHTDKGEKKETDSDATNIEGILGAVFVRASEHVYLYETPYTEQVKLELTISDERMPAVNCLFTMDEEYGVECLLTTANSDYSITVSISAIINDAETVTIDEESDKHTLYYKRYNASTGAYEDTKYQDSDESFPIPVEITTTLRTVTWDVPKVEKGGLSD